MRVAVTGTTGRVGAALARHFDAEHEVIPLPRREFDLGNPDSVAATLDRLECDVFLNPAAVTSLEACEDDPALATRVNAEAPGEIAEWAAANRVKLVHFSTDYVFDGQAERLRSETDVTGALSGYGRSKLAGEAAVLAWPGNCVVRVSWVFGPDRDSFVDSIFDAALAGRPLAAIADKYSLPVFTNDLAGWVEQILRSERTGIVHACNSGEPTSWHGMAAWVVEEMVACGVLAELPSIQKQALDEMNSFRAARPRFTAMETHRLAGILGHPPRDWRQALSEYIRQRCSAVGK